MQQYILTDEGDATVVSGKMARKLPPGYYHAEMDNMGQSLMLLQSVSTTAIHLDDNQQQFFDRIKAFWLARPKYAALGLPHKRGFLLWGPPGTGKTTILRALVAEVIARKGIAVSHDNKNVHELTKALEAVRDIESTEVPILIAIEDIETWEEQRLTTLLDGITDLDNVLFVATTNNIDEVSGRLKNRPSRIDEKIHVGYSSLESRTHYLRSVMPDIAQGDLNQLLSSSQDISVAHLKELVIQQQIYGQDITALGEAFKLQCQAASQEYEAKDTSSGEPVIATNVKRKRH